MAPIAKTCAALLIVVATTAGAAAQTNNSSQCAQPQGGQNLSRQLSQSNGVICPPPTDPGMKQPTPKEGSTPVIPPPGTPGGDPNVQPK
jgi:hypothetical protein